MYYKIEHFCPIYLILSGKSLCPKVLRVNFNRTYDGLYVEQSITSSQCLRGYYKKGINCIWWHKKYRHWWIGDCSNRPENVGHAWLEPDVTCPNQAGSDWRKSGTDEELNGYVTIGIYCIPNFDGGKRPI